MLKTFKKVVEFMSTAKDGEVASKLIFFPDPAEVTADSRLHLNQRTMGLMDPVS